jgi:hypothetical protein
MSSFTFRISKRRDRYCFILVVTIILLTSHVPLKLCPKIHVRRQASAVSPAPTRAPARYQSSSILIKVLTSILVHSAVKLRVFPLILRLLLCLQRVRLLWSAQVLPSLLIFFRRRD